MASDMRYATDIFHISCWNGDLVHVAFVIDCCDREVIAWHASTTGITGQSIRDLMVQTLESRFGALEKLPRKVQWLSDNGPQFISLETIAFGRCLGFEMCTSPAYCPESNGLAEAFVKRFKHDYAYVNEVRSAEAVLAWLPEWFEDYNEHAPHKGLRMMSPREYRLKKAG